MVLVSCASVSPCPAGGATVATESPARPALSLRERGSLPAEARTLLHRRMERHGNDMTLLVMSVVLLSDDGVDSLATNIAREPILSRATEPDSLNARLPPLFFDLQDDLRSHAKSLAEAARSHDRAQSMKAFNELTATCVACHSAYLDDGK